MKFVLGLSCYFITKPILTEKRRNFLNVFQNVAINCIELHFLSSPNSLDSVI